MAGGMRKAALHAAVMQPCLAHRSAPAVNGRLERMGMADTASLAPLKKFSRPRRDRQGRAPRARRACRLAHAVDQHRQPLQYHLPQLLYRIRAPTTTASPISPAPRRPPFSMRSSAGAWPVREIGFTGGEPFMNPDIIDMLGDALERGFQVLLLTNAMQPMLRPRIRDGLTRLRKAHGGRLAPSRQPRPLYGEAARHRADRRVLRQDDRRDRLARARRLCAGARRPHLLGRERGRPRATAMPR